MTKKDLQYLSYSTLLDLPEAVLWFDKDANIFEVNKVACKKWGYSRKEFLQLSIFDINPNMSRDVWAAHWAAKQKDTSTFESSHRRKDGIVFPVDITDIFVELNGVTYSCAIIRDITARKETSRIERLSDFTVQKAGDSIFWICPKGGIKQVNENACNRYGYTKEEFLQMNIKELYRDESAINLEKIFNQLRAERQIVFETEHYTKTDKKVPVEISSHYIEFEDMEYTCSMVRDIGERKQKEAALRGALLEIKELKEKLEAENNYLQEEIEVHNNFGEIISNSPKFRVVLNQIEQVADTSSTVLITGESGTGKELVARALHQLSRRSNRPMIKVNCATLPANLIESELFGHEKGAFTGALSKKLGKFELADGGTLFLDEIGEMPIDLQSKLLRAIQEGEIERLGGQEVKKVDVRIITATNRDLSKEIEEGNFREDLFYRLNVFPIYNMPLRERKEDIPLLIRFFCEKLGAKLGKKITDIPQKVIDKLMLYDFPGNIRELENLIERAIITSRTKKLSLGDWFNPEKRRKKTVNFDSLENHQRNYIIEVLKHTNWRVSGEEGAAKLLGLRPTTLYSKLDRLGIKRSNSVAE